MYYCCYWLLLTVPTLVSIAVQEGSNQYQSVNQGVGNAAGGQKQWDDDVEDSPSPTSGLCVCLCVCVCLPSCHCVLVTCLLLGVKTNGSVVNMSHKDLCHSDIYIYIYI